MSDVPVPVEDELRVLGFDAEDGDGTTKRQWLASHLGVAPTVGASVTTPGGAAAAAAGSRAPRRAAATEGVDAELRHNWVVAGPRNVGGRIKALLVHPTNPDIMYAGSASGGVWKTVDRAESWFPLWHDEASLSIGAMALSPSNPRVIWVATGEFPLIAGAGVFRSENDGETWTRHPVPGPANTATHFEAIAAHPTDDTKAWAVGPQGIFRTADRGAHWDHFRADDAFSDVAFSLNPGGAPTLFLVRATNADVVFLANPDAPPATIRGLLPDPPAAISPTVLTAGLNPFPNAPGAVAPFPVPQRGKIAIASTARRTAYVRFADSELHAGIFRSDNAQPPAGSPGTAITWTRMFDSPTFADENSGWIFLTVATTPDGANVATGMLNLHVFPGSNVAGAFAAPPAPLADWWRKAIAWEIWAMDRGHHADQHVTLFAPDPAGDGGLALWAGNDGGISRSRNWRSGIGHARSLPVGPGPTVPVPVSAVGWQKRSEGILATQMYDLTQSPAHPSVYGCGFQDNGVFLTGGGPSWQLVMGADGGSIAFDPDDLYRFLATDQEDIVEVHVPGLLNQLVMRRGTTVAPFPRALQEGFFPGDTALFVAETTYDRRRGRRVLHARKNVLYGRGDTTGERWQPEPLGQGLELRRVVRGGNGASIRVSQSGGALKLGLVPQLGRAGPPPATGAGGAPVPPAQRVATVRVPGLLDGPFALADGDTLTVSVDGAAPRTVTFRTAAFADITRATASEVAAVVNATFPALAWAVVLPDPAGVAVLARPVATNLVLGGSASLVTSAGTYVAGAGHHAFVVLSGAGQDLRGRNLTVGIGASSTTVDLGGLPHPDAATDRALAALLKARLDGAVAAVGTRSPTLGVRLTHNAAGLTPPPPPAPLVTLGGTAVTSGVIAVPPPVPPVPPPVVPVIAPADSIVLSNGPWNLAAVPAPTLTINDGAVTTTFTFGPGIAVADRTSVTAPEVRQLLVAHLASLAAAARPNVSVDLDLAPETLGQVTEVSFAPGQPDHAWAGDSRGVLYRTSDGGAHWETVAVDDILDHGLEVEAIAVHPTDPGVVLAGLVTTRADKPSLVFRTTNRGGSWSRADGPKDDEGKAAGITGLEFDPDHPDVVYASTDAGVFRSTNRGESWAAFNEGLPNTKAMDLVLEPATRTLRVGMWGRGVYERHIGPRLPDDVRLLVRANPLDTGIRPPVRGPDAMAVPPGTTAAESPDIKVTRLLAVAAAGGLVDGVEFDERIAHEPPTPGACEVLVQVHNVGPFPSTNVRVTVLWAPLAGGRPPALPDSFFTDRAAATFASDSMQGLWRVIGDGPIPADGAAHDVVAAGQPRVRRLPYDWPATVADQPRIGILALVTGDGDDQLRHDQDVAKLVVNERKAAYRETDTLRTADDQRVVLRSTSGTTFRIGNPTGGMATATILGFTLGEAQVTHAPSATLVTFDLAAGAPSGIRLRMDLPAVVSFDATDNLPIGAASANDVANRMTRDLTEAGVPASGGTAGPRAAVIGQAPALVAVTGGTAAPTLGFAPNPAVTPSVTGTVNQPFNLGPGAPQELQVLVRHDHTFVFAAVTVPPVGATPEIPATREIASLNTARAFEIRAAMNAQLAHTGIPVVAESARVALVVRRSLTEAGGREQVTGGEQYADLVASPTVVNPVAARAALFDLVAVLGADRARRNQVNRLYLRSANLGNVTVVNARHRLWSIDPTATPPLTPTLIDAAKLADLRPSEPAIVEFSWNPGAAAGGTRFLILAIVDHDPDRVTDPPPTFVSFEALHDFCRDRPNAATRILEVSA